MKPSLSQWTFGFVILAGSCSAFQVDGQRELALRGPFTPQKGYTGDLTLLARIESKPANAPSKPSPEPSSFSRKNLEVTPVDLKTLRFDSSLPATKSTWPLLRSVHPQPAIRGL